MVKTCGKHIFHDSRNPLNINKITVSQLKSDDLVRLCRYRWGAPAILFSKLAYRSASLSMGLKNYHVHPHNLKQPAMRLYLWLTTVLLFVLSSSIFAEDSVSANQAIDHPAMIPAAVVNYLTKEIDTAYAECEEEGLIVSKAFEAGTVELNSSLKALVVKPRSRCFCSNDTCPMWVFDTSNQQAKVIFESPMAGLLTFSDKKTKGYPDIKVSGGLLTHGYEVGYVWDGKEYQETYNQVWVWNPERKCNEAEIEELKDGKWVKTSNVCLKV